MRDWFWRSRALPHWRVTALRAVITLSLLWLVASGMFSMPGTPLEVSEVSAGGSQTVQVMNGLPETLCGPDWHWIINQIGSANRVPSSITVTWSWVANGKTNTDTQKVALAKTAPPDGNNTGYTSHYNSSLHLTDGAKVTNAVASMYSGWPGRFVLSCPAPTATPTSTPTKTATPANTPTNTPTPENTPTNTPTPENTPTSTPTPENTPTSTPTATATPSCTATSDTINGTYKLHNGSPVVNQSVWLLYRNPDGSAGGIVTSAVVYRTDGITVNAQGGQTLTDSQGGFKFTGVAPGDYIVR